MGKEPGRCRRHPYDNRGAAAGGVCPSCLRRRLLLLCPECARMRPCPCNNSPSLSSSSPADSSSDSSSDLIASQWLGSASMGGGGYRPLTMKEEVKKGNFPISSSVRVAGNVLSGCGGKGGGLKWLNRVFLRAVRAFGGQRKTAKVGKRQPNTLSLK